MRGGAGGGAVKNQMGHDLYVRKEVECQRRYQKLMTDLVHSSTTTAVEAEAAGERGGRKRSAIGVSGDKTFSKGPWTEEEDRKVVELVGKYGPKKWSQIAQELPGGGESLMHSVLLCSMCVLLSSD